MEVNPQLVVLFHHFRRFLEEAFSRGIDVAPLKGAHLLTSVYDEEATRGAMADVDFLVRPEDWHGAKRLLEKLGFEQSDGFGRPATLREFYEACYFLKISEGTRILFEPHRYLIHPARHNIDYRALWARSVESEFEGAPCRRLCPEDTVLHLIIHMMTDSFVAPVRGLNDIERVFKVGLADLDTVLARAEEWECKRATWLTLKLLDGKAPELEIGDRIKRLQIPRSVAAALDILVPDANGFVFSNLGLRAKQAILLPLLIDGMRPLTRFAFDYAFLRLRDLMEDRAISVER